MKKLRMIVELEYDDEVMHLDRKDSFNWFICDVLGASRNDVQRKLIIHSNKIGAEVGTIQLISLLPEGFQVETT